MIDELVGDIRSAVALGVVRAVNDAGQAQTVTVQTHDGVVRADIEVMQPFGFASAPPAAGALCLLFAVGGDVGHLVALPIGVPGARFGGQAAGETTIYGASGARVAIRADGSVEVWASNTVTVHAANVHMTGNLLVDGDISDQAGAHGTLGALRTAYNVHAHPDPQGGSTGTTDHPV
jgi:phage gp45-like